MKEESISIVILCHNQCEELRRNLPAFLAQRYPVGYEVIVVDMLSEDDTALYLSVQARLHPQLQLRSIPSTTRGIPLQELAVTLGIRGASHDRVVLTRPDLCPASSYWLADIAAAFTAETDMLLCFRRNEVSPSRLRLLRWRLWWAQTLRLFRPAQRLLLAEEVGYRQSFFLGHRGFATPHPSPRVRITSTT